MGDYSRERAGELIRVWDRPVNQLNQITARSVVKEKIRKAAATYTYVRDLRWI